MLLALPKDISDIAISEQWHFKQIPVISNRDEDGGRDEVAV
jgi:hypothetical protein